MVSVNRRDIMMNVQGRKKHMTSAQIIIFGFMVVIFMGALLLMLPISTKGPGGAPFLDALFTSTSAVCVTGLIVHDTATYWTEFGQFVIISLIQVGGMGVVTVAVAVAMVSGKKIGLRERSTMQDAISAPKVGGIVRFTGFILKGTFIVELTGAVLMAPQFIKDFGFVKGIWYAVFHSISAFCNAGFDLMGVREPFSSLTHYVGHPVINFAIMMLIVVGGLGFLTWEDIWTNRRCWRKYRMQSKVILTTTALLILIPAVIFYFLEFNGPEWQGWGARIWASLFQSVTPRTAGFNTVDLTAMSEPGQLLTAILMLIGGSPGSTAGGMKTTTLAVLLLSGWAVFYRKEDTQCYGRRISEETVRYAAVVMMMYITLCIGGALAISYLEGLPILICIYETASAIATVGLTLGITPELGTTSRIILILLMYCGRVGGLTLVYAAISGVKPHVSRLPQEKITVG